jgi:hypothetical protein
VPETDDAAVLVVQDLVRLRQVVVGEELAHGALGLLAAGLVLGHAPTLLRAETHVGDLRDNLVAAQ